MTVFRKSVCAQARNLYFFLKAGVGMLSIFTLWCFFFADIFCKWDCCIRFLRIPIYIRVIIVLSIQLSADESHSKNGYCDCV